MSWEQKGVPGSRSSQTNEIEEEHDTSGTTVVKCHQSLRCEWGCIRWGGVTAKIQVKKTPVSINKSLNLIPWGMKMQRRRLSKIAWLGQKCHRWKYCTIHLLARVRTHSISNFCISFITLNWIVVQLLRKQSKWTNKTEADSDTENKWMLGGGEGGTGMAEKGEEE